MDNGIACESCGTVVDEDVVVSVQIPNGAWAGLWEFCPECAEHHAPTSRLAAA